MKEIVLASSSPVRAALLRAAGLRFRVDPPGVDEKALKAAYLAARLSLDTIARRLAAAKALDRAHAPPTLVIGADQTLELDGRLFDKTADLQETRQRLLMLRGRQFSLHSAVAGASGGEVIWSHSETAQVRFRDFSDAYLDDYLARNSAAMTVSLCGFEMEGEGVQLLDGVEGDYFTILGLPLLRLLSWLRRAGGALQ